MSAYRTMLGFGQLERTNGSVEADAKDLPWRIAPTASTEGTRYTAKELVTLKYSGSSITPFVSGTGTKWHRFGANISDDITYNRNVNVLNDLGTRYYTVTTVGRFEPSMTISGLVSYDEAERWMRFAFNCSDPTEDSTEHTKTYVWEFPKGAQTFDIAYVQANTGTNDYAGPNEYHIMTGCAINSMELSYEVGSDMGFKFSLEIMGLSDFWCVDSDTTLSESDLTSSFDSAPEEVFTAGCVSISEDPDSEAEAVAQTDKGNFKLENFLAYRGACGTTYASGFSLGTMNFTLTTDTYSNDPNKYEKYFYGYDGTLDVNSNMSPTKQIKPISTMYLKTTNADPEGGQTVTRSLCIKMETCKVTSYGKSLSNTGDAIMDSPEIRPQKASVILYKAPSSNSSSVDEE